MNNVKAHALGIRILLVMGMLLVMAVASVDTPATVSAHGGDTSLVHLCVNDANAETLTVFPLPIGNANIDCFNPPWPLGAGWSPVDVGTISGVTAGTGLTGGGTTGPVTLDADTTFLQRRVTGACAIGNSISTINQNGSVTCVGAGWSLTGNSGTTAGTHFVGTTNNQALQLHVNSSRALRLEPNATSPNLIGGASVNNVTTGAVAATIAGGGAADDGFGVPVPNRVTDDQGTVGGGWGNIAGSDDVSTFNATNATVSGGDSNTAGAFGASIGGGIKNTAGGSQSTVGGGQLNNASAVATTIGGGSGNIASGPGATVGGGLTNKAIGSSATVSGGSFHNAGGSNSTIGGGFQNITGGNTSTVGGGKFNSASGEDSTIGGGRENLAGGLLATIAGGAENEAPGRGATVAGGDSNIATGEFSFIAGGTGNTAGPFTFVLGHHANGGAHTGAFLFSDSDATPGNAGFATVADREFAVRARGGVRFQSAIGVSGVKLNPGASAWSVLSDRDAKEHFTRVDGQEILEKLSQIPVEAWNYRAQDPSIRHIGPMAQDFYAAFGLGKDEKHISTVDADGVALAAIQGLHQLVQQQDAQIAELEKRLEALEGTTESKINSGGLFSAGGPGSWVLLGGILLIGGILTVRYGRLPGKER